MDRVRIDLNLGMNWGHLCTEDEESMMRLKSSKQGRDKDTKEEKTDLVLV